MGSCHFFCPWSALGGGYSGGYGSARAEVSARYRWQYWQTWKKAFCLNAQGAGVSSDNRQRAQCSGS